MGKTISTSIDENTVKTYVYLNLDEVIKSGKMTGTRFRV